MTDPNYTPVSSRRWQLLLDAFRDAPQRDDRFAGTPEEQASLAYRIRDLFDPPQDGVLLMVKADDAHVLADQLQNARPDFSPRQYADALRTLVKPGGKEAGS